MKRSMFTLSALVGGALLFATSGCNKDDGIATIGGPTKSFTLAWSEYPSWSVFGVAEERNLINGEAGKKGTIEEKWGIDVVLKQMSYDGCLDAYNSGSVDAVCITNMDILAPAIGRNSVAILPTSTSDGADACIVHTDKIATIEDLKAHDSYGLEKSVSQYMFERALEVNGQDPSQFSFKQKDPQVAAEAMQTNQSEMDSIVVWNPFVIQTLRSKGDKAKVLFDSTAIPEEIIDMVVVADKSLNETGGKSFAAVIAEAFYTVNKMLENPLQADKTLTALGANFSGLGLDDMKLIVQQTKFYKTPESGMELFDRADFQNTIMPKVVDFCATHDIITDKPTISYDATEAQLRFDTSYMKGVITEAQHVADEAATQVPVAVE